jgi:hypothetical protein
MMGKKALEAGQILVKELGLEGVLTPEDFISQRESMLESMFPHVDLLPGILGHPLRPVLPVLLWTECVGNFFALPYQPEQ